VDTSVRFSVTADAVTPGRRFRIVTARGVKPAGSNARTRSWARPKISCAARSTASLAAWLASSVPATSATPSATPMIVSADRRRRAVRPRQARVARRIRLEAQCGQAGDQGPRFVVAAASELDLLADRAVAHDEDPIGIGGRTGVVRHEHHRLAEPG